MSNLPLGWMAQQSHRGRSLCLILDPMAVPGIHKALLQQLIPEQYCGFYSQTTVNALAVDGPFVFLIDSLNPSSLNELFEGPPLDWGWLASIENHSIEILAKHWRERLLIGERPQQALYRFHDNRVLARALAHLPESVYPQYLGPVISVCYWQGEYWKTVENPVPGEYPVPDSPPWLDVPAPVSQERAILLSNIGQYLLAEHSQDLAGLPEDLSAKDWLIVQLDLALQWGWQTPEQLHFLIVERLREMHTPGSKNWNPRPEEQAEAHFERLRSESEIKHGRRPPP